MERAELSRAVVRSGLIGGIVVVYLAAVGLIEKFEIRNLVGHQITLGRVLLFAPPLFGGYVLTRPRVRRGALETLERATGLAAGATSGAIVGTVTIAALGLVHAIGQPSAREIFTSVSPGLLDTMQFSRGLGFAAVVWLVAGATAAAAGAVVRLLPRTILRSFFVGTTATLALALLQRILPPAMRELGLATSWLYSPVTQGLTIGGAVIVFVVAAGASFAWRSRREAVRAAIGRLPEHGRRGVAVAGFLALLGILIVLPTLIGSVLTNTLGSVGIFLLMGLGLNIVVGYAGLLDLGYVAFFAAGAYFTALFTGARIVDVLGAPTDPVALTLNFWAAIPLVILVAALVGLMIGAPVLRLRGDYLAIVTLGFGEIARVLVTSNWLREITGGAQGLQAVPAPPGFARDPQPFYYLVLIFVFAAIYVSRRLADSRIGRAWNAMREDEQAAEAMGISATKYKLLAFAIGGAIGCLSGALFAVKIGSLTPASFGILVSITALAVIILGGMGSIPGVIVGALVLIGLPELLSEFEEFRLLIYGAVLVGIMVLRPQGLVPNVRRQRELTEEEAAQDTWLRAREAGASSVAGAAEEAG